MLLTGVGPIHVLNRLRQLAFRAADEGQGVLTLTLTVTLTLTLALTLALTLTLTLTLIPLALSLIWVSSLHLVPSPLKHLYCADDCKVQFDVNDEGVSVKERPFPSEIAVVSGPGSRPDGVI